MVNRGWLPREKIPIELELGRRVGESEDPVELDAIVRKQEKVQLEFT